MCKSFKLQYNDECPRFSWMTLNQLLKVLSNLLRLFLYNFNYGVRKASKIYKVTILNFALQRAKAQITSLYCRSKHLGYLFILSTGTSYYFYQQIKKQSI